MPYYLLASRSYTERLLIPSSVNIQEIGTQHIGDFTTIIFSNNFNNAFESIFKLPKNREKINFLGAECFVNNIQLLKTSKKGLDETEEITYILSICLEIPESSYHGNDEIKNNIKRRDGLDSCMNEILGFNYDAISKNKFIGKSSHVSCLKSSQEADIYTLIYSYYHYAWLIALRTERGLQSISLSNPISEIYPSISKQRKRLINIKRRFLTKDRSNNEDVKKLCRELVEKFNIEARYNTLSDVIEGIEKHFDNLSKYSTSTNTKYTRKSISIISYLSLPLAIIGTALTLSLESDIVQHPFDIIKNKAIIFIIIISFISPLFLILIAHLIDRARGKDY